MYRRKNTIRQAQTEYNMKKKTMTEDQKEWKTKKKPEDKTNGVATTKRTWTIQGRNKDTNKNTTRRKQENK